LVADIWIFSCSYGVILNCIYTPIGYADIILYGVFTSLAHQGALH